MGEAGSPLLVAPLAELVDEGLGHILDDAEAAGHVAVEGGVAHGEFALVAGGQDEPAELVGDSHEQVASDAGLHVLLRDVGLRAVEYGVEGVFHGAVDVLDGDDAERNAQGGGERLRVGHAAVGGVAGGHGDALDVLGAEGVDGDDGGEAGIDAAGEADERLAEAVLADVVAGAEDEGVVDLADGVEGLGHALRQRLAVAGLEAGDVDLLGAADGLEGGGGLLAVEGRAEAAVEDALDVEVGDEELLLELGGAGDGDAVDVEDDAGAVEDELVLAADGVDVADVEAVVGGAGARACARGRRTCPRGRASR